MGSLVQKENRGASRKYCLAVGIGPPTGSMVMGDELESPLDIIN